MCNRMFPKLQCCIAGKISSILTALVIANDADVFAELKIFGCGEDGARY